MKHIFSRSYATWTGEMIKDAPKIADTTYPIDPNYNLPVIIPSLSSGHIYVCSDKLIAGGTKKICIGVLTSKSNPLTNIGGHEPEVPIFPSMLSRVRYDGSIGYQFFFPYAKPFLINVSDINNCIDATEFLSEPCVNDILDTFEHIVLPLLKELKN